MSKEEWIGKETTIDFRRDLRFSQPWRSYSNDEIFTIMRKTKSGLFMIKDSKDNEHPIPKLYINYFNQNKDE